MRDSLHFDPNVSDLPNFENYQFVKRYMLFTFSWLFVVDALLADLQMTSSQPTLQPCGQSGVSYQTVHPNVLLSACTPVPKQASSVVSSSLHEIVTADDGQVCVALHQTITTLLAYSLRKAIMSSYFSLLYFLGIWLQY